MARGRKPTALITGIAGFAGSWLAEELLDAGYRVQGTLLPGESTANLSAIESELDLFPLDITEANACLRKVAARRPRFVFHLAAFASVGRSFEVERDVFRVNWEGTYNLLLAAREISQLKRFLFVSSPDCYGVVKPKNATLTETSPLNPVSPYGISKAAAERTSLSFVARAKLPVIAVRAFNHTGPRQSADFVVPSFARQIARIEAGLEKPVIRVGNLAARRDISDVRDIVRGYRRLAEDGHSGEVYQLCSGRAVSIQSVLNQLLRLSERSIRVKIDRDRLRPVDLPVLRGSKAKADQAVGFTARYTLKETLGDTLDYWRELIVAEH